MIRSTTLGIILPSLRKSLRRQSQSFGSILPSRCKKWFSKETPLCKRREINNRRRIDKLNNHQEGIKGRLPSLTQRIYNTSNKLFRQQRSSSCREMKAIDKTAPLLLPRRRNHRSFLEPNLQMVPHMHMARLYSRRINSNSRHRRRGNPISKAVQPPRLPRYKLRQRRAPHPRWSRYHHQRPNVNKPCLQHSSVPSEVAMRTRTGSTHKQNSPSIQQISTNRKNPQSRILWHGPWRASA